MSEIRELLFGNDPIAWVQHLFGLGHPLPFHVFSLLGDTWGMILVAGIAFWLWGRQPLYAVVGIVLVGAATKVLLALIFKQQRPRGPDIVVYEHLEVSSFPSGHVYETMGPWGLLWAMGCIPFVVAALVVLLVGLGRMYLGAHYLGDVLGGIVFGAALVWAFHRWWPRAQGWLARRSFRFYAGLAMASIVGAVGWIAWAGGHPRRYEVIGILIGAAVALPLEHRFVGFAPAPAGRWLRVLAGLVAIAALLALDRSAPEDALLLGTLTAGLATVWALLGAPLLFARIGSSHGAHTHAP